MIDNRYTKHAIGDHIGSTADRPLEQQTIESDELDLFDAPKPVPAPIAANLPVPVARPRRGRRLRLAIGLLVILIAGGTGGFYWWKSAQSQLPAGMFWGNGRIEADPIDIATKFAGRIAALWADQGDMVKAGQVVARMDTRDSGGSRLKRHKPKSSCRTGLSTRPTPTPYS